MTDERNTLKMEDFKRLTRVKVFKSYPKCNGKTRYGIKVFWRNYPNNYQIVWAHDENQALEIELKKLNNNN